RRAAAKSTATAEKAVAAEASESSTGKTSAKEDAPDASIVQPIVIEDDKPASRRRTGWWRR
ncbi:MAG: hypothetical protein ABF533_11510, partial [Acetobacter persici]